MAVVEILHKSNVLSNNSLDMLINLKITFHASFKENSKNRLISIIDLFVVQLESVAENIRIIIVNKTSMKQVVNSIIR